MRKSGPKYKGQYLDEPELKRLLEAIPDDRDRLMVLVTFWHGLRASEVTSLTGADIRDGHIAVQRLKGSESTIQVYQAHSDPILDESKPLAKLAASLKDEELVFPMSRFSFYRLMKRAGKAAILPRYKGVRPHILKHSIARQTIPVAGVHNVRAWLGHKSLASTGHYLTVTDAEAGQAIANAMRR